MTSVHTVSQSSTMMPEVTHTLCISVQARHFVHCLDVEPALDRAAMASRHPETCLPAGCVKTHMHQFGSQPTPKRDKQSEHDDFILNAS
jgi:hypothetical protein